MDNDRYARYLIAPDQNRTDTRSLEGYCSTIELQAHRMTSIIINCLFLCKREISNKKSFKNSQLLARVCEESVDDSALQAKDHIDFEDSAKIQAKFPMHRQNLKRLPL